MAFVSSTSCSSMKLGDIWLLLLLLNLNLPVREAGDSSYVLRHHGGSSEDATAAVGAWGEPLMIREVVHIPHSGTAGGEFAVQLYLGDLLSEARRGEAVELHCEAMSLRPYKEQCDVLHERIRQLAAMARAAARQPQLHAPAAQAGLGPPAGCPRADLAG